MVKRPPGALRRPVRHGQLLPARATLRAGNFFGWHYQRLAAGHPRKQRRQSAKAPPPFPQAEKPPGNRQRVVRPGKAAGGTPRYAKQKAR